MNAWTRIILLTVCAGGLALELTPNNALVPDASPGPLVECGESGCCPKSCSGHGECVDGACKCFAGYTYYDCSLRTPRAILILRHVPAVVLTSLPPSRRLPLRLLGQRLLLQRDVPLPHGVEGRRLLDQDVQQ